MFRPVEAIAPGGTVTTLSDQVARFPTTRFMGSKEQLLAPLWAAIGRFAPERVLDLCSGSGVVSYMLKAQGCGVVSNDQMAMATTIAAAVVANGSETLSAAEIKAIAGASPVADGMIWGVYGALYYAQAEVAWLDAARLLINELTGAKQALARAALVRACVKKRARGIFTYTGQRYDDGRRDLTLSLADQFREAADAMNAAVFAGPECSVTTCDLSVALPIADVDLLYLDPPYFSGLSDNHYSRRYHFVEALARDWQEVDILHATKTRKLRNYPNPFASAAGVAGVMDRVLDGYAGVPVVISYGSNALPDAADLLALIARHGRRGEVVQVDHRYSFANQAATRAPVRNRVTELILTGW